MKYISLFPPSGGGPTWQPLQFERQIMKSRFANYFLVKVWSMGLLLLHLPSSSVSQSDPLDNRAQNLDSAKNNNNTDTFLKPVRERPKNKRSDRAPVNDFYLLTTKVIFFLPVLLHQILCLLFVVMNSPKWSPVLSCSSCQTQRRRRLGCSFAYKSSREYFRQHFCQSRC